MGEKWKLSKFYEEFYIVHFSFADQLLVTTDPHSYKSICQGVVKVENLDDGQELLLTDVCKPF